MIDTYSVARCVWLSADAEDPSRLVDSLNRLLGYLDPPRRIRDAEHLRVFLQALMAYRLLLAWRKHEVIGMLVYTPTNRLGEEPRAIITDLVVHPQFRRRGVATLLLQEAMRCAATMHIAPVFLVAEASSSEFAVAFATKHGFREAHLSRTFLRLL